MFSWNLSRKREELLEILLRQPQYSRLTKADLLENGLISLIESDKQTEKLMYPSIEEYEKWQEFYKTCSEEEYKKIDLHLNRLMSIHNKKWEVMG